MALQIAMQLLYKKKKIFRTGWGVDKTAKNRKTTLKNNIILK
jgi:hypothetical protein